MTTAAEVFSRPFNWCDRRCERCPLEDHCPVRRAERQQRWVHEARGEDPDDPAMFARDLGESIDRAARALDEIARQEGIDLDAPRPNVPIVLDAVRLEKAGLGLVKCLVPLGSMDADLSAVVTAVGMKTARIAGYLEEHIDDAWEHDTAPNLLLLERLREELGRRFDLVRARVDDNTAASLGKALDDLDRCLGPLVASVDDASRRLLAALVARGAAPSPFCVVDAADD